MTSLQDLLDQKHPNGVQRLPLGELGEFVRGGGFSKADLTENGRPAIHYGQIYTAFRISTEIVLSRISDNVAISAQVAKPGDLLIAISDVTPTNVGRAVAWLGETEVSIGGDILAFRHNLNPKYVAYFFDSTDFALQKTPLVTGATIRHLSAKTLSRIRIPVPSVEVQNEIVRTLDAFTALQTELEAELEARKSQYEHYRNSLLEPKPGESRTVPLRELCTVFNGYAFKSELFNTDNLGLPLIRIRDVNSGISGTYYSGFFDDKYLVQQGDLLIGMDGDFNAIRWSHGEALLNQRVCRLQDFSHETIPGYLFHWVRGAVKTIQKATSASTVKHLSSGQIGDIMIPLPAIDYQKNVVNLLDGLDALISGAEHSLAVEIAARRLQYEYYRDQLLHFQEA